MEAGIILRYNRYYVHNMCFLFTDALLTLKNEKNPNENYELKKKYQIDEAIRLAGSGFYQLKIFILFGLTIVCQVIEMTNMAYVLPIAQCDINMSMKEQGFANSVVFIGMVVSTYFWGFLSDTWGRRNVLLTSYLITFISSSLSALSMSAIMIMISRFFVGVG